ncbi:MAG TPA: hypothetical protein DCZ94_18195 [Lentisphaeria bacterium]|nr:MAG: hypothetical protein A2X48_22995 [Lentisphaerae bacterium GWF2_49_21]HBC88878.1 hypothetical protein [Lentisphaeria bacterium]
MSVTLRDVAKKAGVSIVTASRVFNGKESVKPAFKKKVFDAAKSLNYTPNLLARGLAKSNLKIISVYMGELENPYFGSLATNLAKEFTKYSYELIICDSISKTLELNRSLATSGSVLVSFGKKEVLEKITETHPVVGISCTMTDNANIPNIDLDFKDAYTELYERAVYSDKDKIAFYSPLLRQYPHLSGSKFIHVYSAMKRKGHTPAGDQIFADDDAVISFMELSPGSINCVFCENDMQAARLHGKLIKKGYKVPEDVIVIGCDGTLVLDGMWSVKIDTAKIAAKAAELFRDHAINGASNGTHTIKPEPIYK